MAALRPAGPPPIIAISKLCSSRTGSSMTAAVARTIPGTRLAKRTGGQLVEETDGRPIRFGQLADANSGRHDRETVLCMIEAEKMADLVERHGARGVGIERLALMVVHRENDVRVGDHPVIVAGPASAAADRLGEAIDPIHMHLGGGR